MDEKSVIVKIKAVVDMGWIFKLGTTSFCTHSFDRVYVACKFGIVHKLSPAVQIMFMKLTQCIANWNKN